MTQSMTKKMLGSVLIGFAMLASAAQSFADPAGHVIYITGEASLERAVPVPLAKDSVVESGDVITTGTDGRVQLRMANGEFISLRPNTRFVIDEFVMPTIAEEPSTGRSFYSLLKGGFVAITNSFGTRDLNSYRIHTPVATLGIRGSTIGGLLDDNGLIFGVKEGGGSMSNSQGIQLVDEGQVATAPDTFTAPTLASDPQPLMDKIFGDSLPPADAAETGAAGGAAPAEGGAAGAEGAPAAGSGGIGIGTGLLILGGIGILAEALSGGSSSTTATH